MRNNSSRVMSLFDPVFLDERQDHGGDFVVPKDCKGFCYCNEARSTLPLLGCDHCAKKQGICRGIRTSFSFQPFSPTGGGEQPRPIVAPDCELPPLQIQMLRVIE